MTLWDFLNSHPVWGLVYLVLVLLGINGVSASLGAGFHAAADSNRKGKQNGSSDGDGRSR